MRLAVLIGALCLAASAASAQSTLEALQGNVDMRPLSLKRAVFNLKEGEVWGHWGAPAACDFAYDDLRWKAGKVRAEADADRLGAIFDEEVTRANFKTTAPANLFDNESITGGLQVAALIKGVHARLCGLWNSSAFEYLFRVSATMDVEWQIYDPLRRQVVGKITTTASVEDKHRSSDALDRIITAAFRSNAQRALADPEFRRLAAIPAPTPEQEMAGRDRAPLVLAMASGNRVPVSDAAGSVVTILSEDGHGSGFLISADGYLITNRHVVGTSKTVRVRWSDGFEGLGEVVRSDKRRDVALVKASTHSRQPLTLKVSLVRPGDTVFAIGTPLDEKFQGTLTKGVVSAYRIMDGLNYLQSDVSVNPGNSGGPLLDEKGAVIGITVSIFREVEDVPTGINFFIPIGDALDFLNLKPAPVTAAQ